MRIVDSEQVQWHTGPGHREPGVFLRDLLTGPEGESGNYWLVMVRVEDQYDTPAHHHNFEQVRVMLDGRFNFGPQDQEEGTIGYFSEGTVYEQQARGRSRMLLLQCEGGSRSRYLSQAEMRRAVHELKQQGGRFEAGVFHGVAPDGGTVEKDAVEALWEHAVGRPVAYPRPRFQGPVIMDPEAFAFVALAEGVEEKRLGEFGERRLALSIVRIAPGHSWRCDTAEAKQLLFVREGSGQIDASPLAAGYAVEIEKREDADIVAGDKGIELLRFGMPR